MNYIEGICDEPMSSVESQSEAVAHHEYSLNVLYLIGSEYGVSDSHMKLLCGLACIRFAELQKHKGVTA